jgi:hypothetical protein
MVPFLEVDTVRQSSAAMGQVRNGRGVSFHCRMARYFSPAGK